MKRTKRIPILIAILAGGTLLYAAGMFSLDSFSFTDGGTIPIVHAHTDCGGENISPALSWDGAPEGTKSFVLICDDPDAPTPTPWVHWVVYDIPATITGFDEGVPKGGSVPEGGTQGKNSWNERGFWDALGYDGPCPPNGTHTYVFTIYALDTMLNLPQGQTKNAVERAMAGHVLESATYTGEFGK